MMKMNKTAKKAVIGVLTAAVLSTSAIGGPVYLSNYTIEAATSTIEVSDYSGWLESAYVEWAPVTGASSYQVYYKTAGASDSTYTKIDGQLVRQYSSYYRADVLGLKAGNYDIKIVPVISGVAYESKAATKTMTVKAQSREGFAFSKQSPMGTGSGGYNDDGTVPSNAQVIYVTKDTVNTVTLDVITNSKGTTTTCTGLSDILAKRQKGYDKTPLIIRLIGTITKSDISGLNSSGYLQIKGCYNVSVEGVGEDATVSGWGLLLRDAHNVEVKNLGVMLFPDDGISLDTDNENIWVHNNDIFYGTAGSDADQAKGDGSCDVKGFSNYVTVSYNHFWDSGKCSLCGMSDSQEFFVTYHHNWYDHSDSRHPRIRVGSIHIYNNYFDGNSKYGVGVTKGSSAFVEANYFRNCKYPMLTSLQGTDVYGDNTGTFSGEAGGMIKAYNNKVIGATRLVYAQEDSTEFDAYLATSRDETVSSKYSTVSGGNTYNNFDTASTMYSYSPDSVEDVESVVTTYAGRINGGDFDFEFNDAVDDTSYAMNTELMSKIKAYKTSLVAVGEDIGEIVVSPSPSASTTPSVSPSPSPSVAPSVSPSPSPSASTTPSVSEAPSQGTSMEHNFTTSGTSSSYYTISGNLSTSKGTVTYNGLSLSTCLKIESSTSIKFTAASSGKLTLVFNDGCNKNINIDGTSYTISNGVLEVNLGAGTHTITKRDSINLYYISYTD